MAEFLLKAVLAGLAGTIAMTLVMTLITRIGLANADMVRAIGSLVTRSLRRALPVGIALYTLGGLLFAVPYGVALTLLALKGVWPILGVSAVIGFAHGFVMSFVLVVSVAEHHPMEQFRDSGFGVAVAHIFGHIAYGLGVGLVLGLASVQGG